MTAIRDLNQNFAKKAVALEAVLAKGDLLQKRAQSLVDAFNAPYENAADLLQLLHESQRVLLLNAAGAGNDAQLLADLENTTSPLWREAAALPVEDALQKRVGEQFLQAPLTKPDANILIRTQAYAPLITETVVEGYIDRAENFDVVFSDADWQAKLLNAIDRQGAKTAGEYLVGLYGQAEKAISISANTDAKSTPIDDKEKAKLFNAYGAEYSNRARNIDNFFTLTRVPTPKDAQIDNMDFEKYLRLFFELCDQPWEAVTKAQAKLIEKFDAAKTVHITNDDGTDLTLDIAGFTFANSVVKKNIPGSEIFSAPKRDGVNGTLVAKGKFMPPHGEGVVEDITLRFVNGEAVDIHAAKGEDSLRKALATDEGARFVGELGIGTNPWLQQHVMNGLLVEKIGGSFHLALGACYTYTEYDGTPVHMDNGNHSKMHWDVTTMLKGRGGKMYLDGELIQDNGQFVGEEFRVFNEGWKALPPEERPKYWQDLLKQRDAESAKGFAARIA